MLSFRGVRITYPKGAQVAVSDASFDVAAGECVALVGPSGGGKTSLLRAVNATVPLAGGAIFVDGVDVAALRGAALRRLRSQVAVIPQQHDLIGRLPVSHNVMAGAFGRWNSLHALRFFVVPLPSELAQATEALESVGIPQMLRKRTSELSGGEQQRVAIARALVQQPAVMLADEPVASLDPVLGERIVRLLCDLARERGAALVCSLHQPDLALKYFDRVIGIDGGSLRFDRVARSSDAGDLAFAP